MRANKLKNWKYRAITPIVSVALLGFSAVPSHAVAPTHGAYAPISTTWGVGAIALTPPTSNSPGSWVYTSANTNVASIIGNTASIKNVGTTTITATQLASGSFDAKSATTTLTVLPGTPTLGNFPAITLGVDAGPITITPPSSTSAGSWSYSISNAAIATISGNILTPKALGTVTLVATQAANFNWATAAKSTTVTITGGAPTTGPFVDLNITLGSVANLALVPPTSNSSGAWTFTSSNTAVATVTGNILRPIKIGTSVITATQSAWGNYGSVSKTMTVTIQGGPPTLGEFKNVSANLQPFASNQIVITPPTSNSTGPWTFSSSNTQIATVNGAIATLLNKGKTTITATQAALGDYGASSPVTMELTVLGAKPVIGNWENLSRNISDSRFIIEPPSSSSGGKWTFKSLDPNIAEVSGTEILLKGVGQAVIQGTQTADWNWEAGESQMTLTVIGIEPTIGTWEKLEAGVGDEPFAITPPTSNSDGVWSFASSNDSIVKFENERAVVVGVGTVNITAIQAISGNFGASKPITTTLVVKPRATHGAAADLNYRFDTTPGELIPPTSNSKGEWSFVSSDNSVISITGRQIRIVGAGSAKVEARQKSDENFAPTLSTFTVRITKASPQIVWPEFEVKAGVQTSTFTTPKSNSKGQYNFRSSNTKILEFVDGKLVAKKAGNVIVTATQSETNNFTSGVVANSIQVVPDVSIKLKGRVITVKVIGASAKVKINGVKAKLGKNRVGPGTRKVEVISGGETLLKRTFKVS